MNRLSGRAYNYLLYSRFTIIFFDKGLYSWIYFLKVFFLILPSDVFFPSTLSSCNSKLILLSFYWGFLAGGCKQHMSSDTAKENASVVDSSVTEWKNERGNMDEPGKSDAKSLLNLVIVLDICLGFLFE